MRAEKGQAGLTIWPFWLKLAGRKRTAGRDYFAVDAGAGATVSFFCAQAPRLNAPAATAKISITLRNLTY
jgi:hypothetical protein